MASFMKRNKVSPHSFKAFLDATADYDIDVVVDLKDPELDSLFEFLKIPPLDRSAIRKTLRNGKRQIRAEGTGLPNLFLTRKF